MKNTLHDMKCNVVVETGRRDRFFMDMRVYEVLPLRPSVEESGLRSPVWRGIYLAVERQPSSLSGPGKR